MSKKDLPSYMVMVGACICIILLVAARHHPPSRQKIKEIWHGRVYWETELKNTSSGTNLRSVHEPAKREAPIDFDKDIEEIKHKKSKELSNSQPKIDHSYDKIHKFLHNVERTTCKKWKVLIGENSKEPDVHICLDNISPPCVVYSFGIANNWIFDDYMISKGCHVYSFDPSMNVGKHKRHKNHLFEPIGIGIKSGVHEGRSTLYGGKTNYDVLTLGDIMKRYNNDHVDIIRMDIEYAEWDVLQEWLADDMFSKMDQLLLEIHMWPNRGDHMADNNGFGHSEILHSIPMTLFHEARNKWDGTRIAGDMTSVYEVGFLLQTEITPKSITNSQETPAPKFPYTPTSTFFFKELTDAVEEYSNYSPVLWDMDCWPHYPTYGGSETNFISGTRATCRKINEKKFCNFLDTLDNEKTYIWINQFSDFDSETRPWDKCRRSNIYYTYISFGKTKHSNDIPVPTHTTPNEKYPKSAAENDDRCNNAKLDVSFRGQATTPLRKKIMSKKSNIKNAKFEATSTYGSTSTRMFELLHDSKFGLVPRGDAMFSYRLMETMAMGVVPIIISDGWQLPFEDMLDWSEFSIRIHEDDISTIPNVIEAYRDKACEMSAKVYDVYHTYMATPKAIIEAIDKQILMVFDNILKGAWKSIDLTSYNKLIRGLTFTSKPLAEGHSAQLVKERQLYVALAKLPFVRNICEIGFNGGHSAGLWLLANPTASVTMFDIWTHPYTVPAEAFLRSPEAKQYGIVNGDERLTIIKGSSHVTLKPYAVQNPKSCDIISVDGDHSHDGAVLDLRDVFPLARDEKTIILLDDTNCISSWCVDNAMKQVISEGYYEKLLGISEADRTRGVSLLKPIQQTLAADSASGSIEHVDFDKDMITMGNPGKVPKEGQIPPKVKTNALPIHKPMSSKEVAALVDYKKWFERMSEIKTPASGSPADKLTQTDTRSGYEKIYHLMKNARPKICSNTHILEGENSKEPDVHICLDNITPPCTVYSFGIAYNWIFDDFMVSKGCDVFSFDPSMNVGKHSRSEHHLFEPIGIGPASGTHKGKSTLYTGKKYNDKNNYQLLSLSDMMQRYGHDHIDIIRMDVESAEWDVLKQWNDDKLWGKMDQLLLEVHMWDKKNQEYYSNALSNIPMTLFHKARNKWNGNKAFEDMTQVYELGFLVNTNAPVKYPRKSTAPKLWDKKDNNKYDEVAAIMKALDERDIDSFLCHGSALGAHRNHGWISGDKDADLIVMSTDSKKIEKALKMASYNPGHSKGTFKPQTDGNGPGYGGFGYHVKLKSEMYIDLWLYEEVSDEKVQLIGYERGAHRWCKKYNRLKTCKAWPKSWLYKIEYVPFGPYLMASAHKEFLDYMFSDTWRYMCGGWAKGKTSCSKFHNSQTFVFWSQDNEGNRVATAKKGNKTQHQFVVKNGEYKLKYINP